MARFVFRLQTVKKLREDRLTRARRDFGELQGKLNKILDDLDRTLKSREDLLECTSSAIEIGLHGSLIETQGAKAALLRQEIVVLEKEIERHRSWVAHLGKELKIIEKLEEKAKAAFDEQERLREKKIQDAWVVERWSRNQEGESGS